MQFASCAYGLAFCTALGLADEVGDGMKKQVVLEVVSYSQFTIFIQCSNLSVTGAVTGAVAGKTAANATNEAGATRSAGCRG
jgi:uncharacterized membrane protein